MSRRRAPTGSSHATQYHQHSSGMWYRTINGTEDRTAAGALRLFTKVPDYRATCTHAGYSAGDQCGYCGGTVPDA